MMAIHSRTPSSSASPAAFPPSARTRQARPSADRFASRGSLSVAPLRHVRQLYVRQRISLVDLAVARDGGLHGHEPWRIGQMTSNGTGRDSGSAWLKLPFGETMHVTEDDAERQDFHYDRLRGVVSTDRTTWFLAERDNWLLGSADDAQRSLLVRWDD